MNYIHINNNSISHIFTRDNAIVQMTTRSFSSIFRPPILIEVNIHNSQQKVRSNT